MRVRLLNLDQFRQWLTRDGASFVPQSPNPFEILRYVSAGSNSIGLAYRNDRNSSVALSGAAVADYRRFASGQSPGAPSANKLSGARRAQLVRRLNARDGQRCFFCHAQDSHESPLTIEHLLSRSAGGTHNLDNLCHACLKCNQFLADAPVVRKLEYYHQCHGLRTAELRSKGYETND